MTFPNSHIQVFEHEAIFTDRGTDRISQSQLKALQAYHGEQGCPYYSLVHNGVKFCEYVGVIQVGRIVIEVLPKIDKSNDKDKYQKLLIDMLNSVGLFNSQAPSSSELRLRNNSILSLYFELFINEVEYLQRRGFIKKYRQTEGNQNALKGRLLFSKQINHNIIHKERFYVKHTYYDKNHLVHSILMKTIMLLKHINTDIKLDSRLEALLLHFPVTDEIMVTESIFQNIVYDRKTEPYKNALEIARLLLLNYHPDVRSGNENVLALMFDMNHLWERFVFSSLQKHKTNDQAIVAQNVKRFWKPHSGPVSKMRPDIVIKDKQKGCLVLDTKWKVLNGLNPSSDDLRQMFVYAKYYSANKVALVYPGHETYEKSGRFFTPEKSKLPAENDECSLISIGMEENVQRWQKKVSDKVNEWMS